MPGENVYDWSVTAANNGTADSLINWQEGQARATVNNSARSEMAAVAKFRNLLTGAITTGGTAAAQTFVSGVGYTAVPTGMRVLLKIGLENAAGVTLNMDGIGDVAIKNLKGELLAAGDLLLGSYAEFLYDGTNWIMLSKEQRGLVLLPGGTTIINVGSPASTVDFTSGIDGTYDEYRIVYHDVTPVTTGAILCLRYSMDSGATFYSGATHYYGITGWTSYLGQVGMGSENAGGTFLTFFMMSTIQNTPNFASGIVNLFNPAGTTGKKRVHWHNGSWEHDNGECQFLGGGRAGDTNVPVNGLRFFFNTGGVASGTFRLYGVQK